MPSVNSATSRTDGAKAFRFVALRYQKKPEEVEAGKADHYSYLPIQPITDLNTTMRYVHLNDDDVRAAMEKGKRQKGGHKTAQGETDTRVGQL